MKMNKTLITIIMILTIIPALAINANAQFIAVNELGYHPDSYKQALIYPGNSTEEVELIRLSGNEVVGTYVQVNATDYDGNEVSCIATTPCKIIDFTDFNDEGEYKLRAGSIESAPFQIRDDIYESAAPVLFEFFNAMLQQNSGYHKDFHGAHNPPFSIMADGSYLMTAGQASTLLIQLGNGYRRNPDFYNSVDEYNLFGSDLPDVYEYTKVYVNYLKGIQGIKLKINDTPGFRLDQTYDIINAFVPGPTDITTTGIYLDNEDLLKTVPVISLCGELEGTAYNDCLANAEKIYACEEDEICANITYKGKYGHIIGNEGYDVSSGWYYEWSCNIDINPNEELFNDKLNPCLIFDNETSMENTIGTLHGYMQVLPIIYHNNPSEAQELFNRAYYTYLHVKDESMNKNEKAHLGSALFLMYEHTGDIQFLEDAESLSSDIEQNLNLWNTESNQIYWELYARYADKMESEGIITESKAQAAKEKFSDYIYGEYKDQGLNSIGRNAEGITLKYKNYDFSNSRAILLTGLTSSLSEEFTPGKISKDGYDLYQDKVAQNHLGYILGQNIIEPVQMADTNLTSYSFIFGLGTNNPEQYHSRYLINTGLSSYSNGEYLGTRGTGLKWKHQNGTFEWLDGMTSINGYKFGASGNDYGKAIKNPSFQNSTTYLNGKKYIPGWINGPFGFNKGPFMNYQDSWSTYEFTENTDEKTAVALALMAHLDARYNDKERTEEMILEIPAPEQEYNIRINSTPPGAQVIFNGDTIGVTPVNITRTGGTYNIILNLTGYDIIEESIIIEENKTFDYILQENQETQYNVTITSNPTGAFLFVNGTEKGTTPVIVNLTEGSYEVKLLLEGYENKTAIINVDSGATMFSFNLTEKIVEEPQENIIITSNSSTLPMPPENKTLPITLELEEMTFYIELNGTAQVEWKIMKNDVLFYNTTTSLNNEHEFKFNPDIFYAGSNKEENTKITAKVLGTTNTYMWEYEIRDLFNAFFDPDRGTGSTTRVEVGIYNQKYNFSNVIVTIKGKNYTLINDYQDEEETKWTEEISGMQNYGNQLTHIYGINDSYTNEDVMIDVASMKNIGYFREVPPPPSSGGGGSSGGSSGGGTAALPPPTLELIYTIIEKDVLMYNETQELRLDANSTRGDISRVKAILIDPLEFPKEYDMRLTSGTGGYGTWSLEITSLITGPWKLDEIILYDEQGRDTSQKISNRQFYVVSEEVSDTEELQIVYTVLSSGTADYNETIKLTLDARDSQGVAYIIAKMTSNKGYQEEIPLFLVKGTRNYGTWEGTISFPPNTSDETFSIELITIANNNSQVSYPITQRSIYVREQSRQDSQNISVPPLTGMAIREPLSRESIMEALKSPFASTIIAFLATLIVLIAAFGIWSAKRA